jgi:hypothetical protein
MGAYKARVSCPVPACSCCLGIAGQPVPCSVLRLQQTGYCYRDRAARSSAVHSMQQHLLAQWLPGSTRAEQCTGNTVCHIMQGGTCGASQLADIFSPCCLQYVEELWKRKQR